MIRLNRILQPTDFSRYSTAALPYACELAQRFDAELHLYHVVEYVTPTFPLYGVNTSPPKELADWRRAAAEQLKELAEERKDNLKIVCALGEGKSEKEIANYAKENEIDLIALGTHGRTGLLHFLLGSVAEKVLRHSPCPVLTVNADGRGVGNSA